MIVQELPGFKILHLDNLKSYALALLYANGEYKTATEPLAVVTGMAEIATHTRAVLLADANSLITHGVLPLRPRALRVLWQHWDKAV